MIKIPESKTRFSLITTFRRNKPLPAAGLPPQTIQLGRKTARGTARIRGSEQTADKNYQNWLTRVSNRA
jgi:hypothetical protein